MVYLVITNLLLNTLFYLFLWVQPCMVPVKSDIVEEIKKEKLQQMKEMGIDEKYVVDLEKLSVIPTDKLQSLHLQGKDKKKK